MAIIFVLVFLRKINNSYTKRHPRAKFIKINLKEASDIIYISRLLRTWGVLVQNTHITHNNDSDEVISILEVNMKISVDSSAILVDLLKETCVIKADYITDEEVIEKYDIFKT